MNKKSNKNTYRMLNGIVIVGVMSAAVYCIVKFLNIADDQFNNAAQIEEYISPVNSRITAYINKIYFTEYQSVKKGDTLVVLDDTELKIALAKSQADLFNAIAAKESKQASLLTSNSRVDVIASAIEGARVKMKFAETNHQRYKALLEDQAVTPQQYEDAQTQYQAQKASLEEMVKQKSSSNHSANEVSVSLKVDDAKIKAAEAAVEMAKLNLKYTVILATSDGTIGRRKINEGQLVQAGQQIVSLVQNNEKWVSANYLEKRMKDIYIGQLINISVDALEGQIFEGRVIAISGATGARYSAIPTDNSAGNFIKVQQRIPVRIEFTENNSENMRKKLRAGMNVIVTKKEDKNDIR